MLRDLTFDRMKRVPYLHREMARTLAGLKTGMFRWRTADAIVNCVGGEGARRGHSPDAPVAAQDRGKPVPGERAPGNAPQGTRPGERAPGNASHDTDKQCD